MRKKCPHYKECLHYKEGCTDIIDGNSVKETPFIEGLYTNDEV